MRKLKFVSVFVLLALLLIVSLNAGLAQKPPPDRPDPDGSLSNAHVESDSFEEAVQSGNADSKVQAPTTISDNEIEEMQTLTTRWENAVLQVPGWFHIVTQHDRNKDQVGNLPNGQPIPLDYVSDTWYQLNDKGVTVAVVAMMKEMGGQLVQVSTFRDGIWRNLTLNEKWPGEAFTPRLDFGFSKEVAQIQPSALNRQEETIAGRSVLIFTIHDDFARPIQMEGYKKPMTNADISAAFDPQTGQMLYLERVLVTVEGERWVSQRVDVLTVERTEPPPNTLTFLNQEVTR
mgnify:CR=1 FL=1